MAVPWSVWDILLGDRLSLAILTFEGGRDRTTMPPRSKRMQKAWIPGERWNKRTSTPSIAVDTSNVLDIPATVDALDDGSSQKGRKKMKQALRAHLPSGSLIKCLQQIFTRSLHRPRFVQMGSPNSRSCWPWGSPTTYFHGLKLGPKASDPKKSFLRADPAQKVPPVAGLGCNWSSQSQVLVWLGYFVPLFEGTAYARFN